MVTEYREPITVTANDPLCTATALNGTIIGILFEKTGKELKKAIGARVINIDAKMTNDKKLVDGIAEFLRKKEDEIIELDKFCNDRLDAKREVVDPVRRDIEKLHQKIFNTSIEFDRQTEKELGAKAVGFTSGFDEVKDSLKKIDEYIQETRWNRGTSVCGMSGPSGSTGSLGNHGAQGPSVYFSRASDDDNEERIDQISESENKALAKLNTLKSYVSDYSGKVRMILNNVKSLDEEKRRLTLIHNNLIDDRVYKLDLNKLSAFGFEDIAIVD